MQCHEVDYEIHGDDMQLVEVELDPGERVIAEAGAMNYMEDGIDFEAKMGDGSKPSQAASSDAVHQCRKAGPDRRIDFSDPLHPHRAPAASDGWRSPRPTPARSSR